MSTRRQGPTSGARLAPSRRGRASRCRKGTGRPRVADVSGGRRRAQAVSLAARLRHVRFAHPAQVVVAAFSAAVVVGTLLLLIPTARRGEGGASVVEALATATSAICVTGLVVVDTPTSWSGFRAGADPAAGAGGRVVALMAVAVVVGSTAVLLQLTEFTLDEVLFEVISAASTTGLSTGITSEVGTPGQLLLAALMFLGRLGPITLAPALALRSRPKLDDLPEERPIIG